MNERDFEPAPFRPELREILRRVDVACAAAPSVDVQAYLWDVFWRGNDEARRRSKTADG